jgi:hypothetical protein
MVTSLVERLGEPEQVAATAQVEYRRVGFFQRHRWLAAITFVLLPIPLLVLGWMVAIFVFGLGIEAVSAAVWLLVERLGGTVVLPQDLPWYWSLLCHLILSATVAVPAAVLVYLYGRLSRRARCRRWATAAGVILVVVSTLITHDFRFSPVAGESSIMFGLGLGLTGHRIPGPWIVGPKGWQFFQLALPMAVLVAWRSRRRQQNLCQN